MGYRRIITLLDCAKAGYWVRLKCPCGREVHENPLILIERMREKRRSEVRLDRLGAVLKCVRCGRKDFTAEHCQAPAMWSG